MWEMLCIVYLEKEPFAHFFRRMESDGRTEPEIQVGEEGGRLSCGLERVRNGATKTGKRDTARPWSRGLEDHQNLVLSFLKPSQDLEDHQILQKPWRDQILQEPRSSRSGFCPAFAGGVQVCSTEHR